LIYSGRLKIFSQFNSNRHLNNKKPPGHGPRGLIVRVHLPLHLTESIDLSRKIREIFLIQIAISAKLRNLIIDYPNGIKPHSNISPKFAYPKIANKKPPGHGPRGLIVRVHLPLHYTEALSIVRIKTKTN
jgi:hypothetical protein